MNIFLCIIASATVAVASDIGSPRIASLGGAGAAVATGLDALGTNPALIGGGSRSLELTFYPVGGYVVGLFGTGTLSTPVLQPNSFDNLFSTLNVSVNADDKSKLISAINIGGLNYRTEGTILAGVYKLSPSHALGFSIKQRAAASYQLYDGVDTIIRNVAQSLNLNDIVLRNVLSAEAVWFNEYALSYAFTSPEEDGSTDFAVGGSLKYIQGLGYITLLNGNQFSTIIVNTNPLLPNQRGLQTTIDYDVLTANGGQFNSNTMPLSPFFTLFPNGVGSGFGLDIGAMKNLAMSGDLLSVGFSVTDIGSINWGVSPEERSVHRIDTFSTTTSLPVDTLKRYEGVSLPTSSFTTFLPTRLHLGLSLETFTHGLFVPRRYVFEYTQGLNNSVGNSTSPRIAVGAEWEYKIWYYATGFSYSADEHFSWSLGGGLHLSSYILMEAAFGRINGFWESPQLVNFVATLKLLF